MNQFGAIIVLYKPTLAQLENLIRVSKVCPCVVAVDNSPETSEEVKNLLNIENVFYIINKNFGGIAGAFNRGIEELEKNGVTTFFLFDQDSNPENSFFMKMYQSKMDSGESEVIIGPNVFDINLKRYSPRLIFNKWTYNALPIQKYDKGLLPCSSIISSGTLITISAFKKIGSFREDYFIDHVDTEYCLRARLAGVKIFINADVILSHAIGERAKRKMLFLTFRPNNHNALRRYYISRNGFHLCFVYGLACPAFFIINLLRMAHEFLGIIFFEKGKFKKTLALSLGLVDAIFFRLGDLEPLRPKFFTYFSK